MGTAERPGSATSILSFTSLTIYGTYTLPTYEASANGGDAGPSQNANGGNGADANATINITLSVGEITAATYANNFNGGSNGANTVGSAQRLHCGVRRQRHRPYHRPERRGPF